ncbi:hypothetical protein ACFQJ5_19485 [Halomicroarcula sp. GCM10025324]|uniref:hypothetical protein n=1 Tax=Halomicroarcula sp. GCM10025324 TaxID=3252667 RepID=UPI00361802A5
MSKRQTTPDSKQLVPSITSRRRLLKGTAGVAATAVAIPTVSGLAAAHFPNELDIDVQPDNADNFIDVDEHDEVEVAVHPAEFLNGDGERETFDPTTETVRYRFGSRSTVDDGGGARPEGDGDVRELDGHHGESHEALVLTFPVDEMGFDGGEETAWLYWERDESGEHGYAGMDSVSIYGTDISNRGFVKLLQQLMTWSME